MTLPAGAPISDRFKDLTLDREPVLSMGAAVAVLLTLADQYLHFTDGQVAIIVYFLPIVIATITRQLVWSPASHAEAVAQAAAAAKPVTDPVTTTPTV